MGRSSRERESGAAERGRAAVTSPEEREAVQQRKGESGCCSLSPVSGEQRESVERGCGREWRKKKNDANLWSLDLETGERRSLRMKEKKKGLIQ
jgi:hypothetical protein